MNYVKMAEQIVCKMAMPLALMFAACSMDDSHVDARLDDSPAVPFGGAEEETGVYALAGRVLGSGGSPSISSSIWQGHMVRMVELDSVTFDTTDNIYYSSVTNASGVFSFDSVNLKSPYVLLELSPVGNGENWWASLDTLIDLGLESLIAFNERFIYRIIVNLRETKNVDINVLTTLEATRLRSLVKQGQSFEEARSQAGREVMEAFGFYDESFRFGDGEYAGSKEGREILSFVSVFVETNYSCLDKKEIADFGNSGTFANLTDSIKTKCVEYPAGELWSERHYDGGTWKDITNAERALFGNFLSSLYGVGRCTDEKEGDSLVITYLGSELDLKIKCKPNDWIASAFRMVREDMPRTEGTMTDPRDGKTYRTVTYEIESGSQTWMMENLVYSGEGVTAVLDSAAIESVKAYREQELHIARIYHGSFDSPNDSLIWLNSLKSDRDDWIFYVDSAYWSSFVKYKWFDALGLDSALVYTDSGSINSEKVFAILDSVEAVNGHYQGLCPDGWRIPKIEDWANLFKQAYRTTGEIVEDVNQNWKMGVRELPGLGFGPVTAERFIVRPEAETEKVMAYEENVYILEFALNLKIDWIGAFRLNEQLDRYVNVRCIKNE